MNSPALSFPKAYRRLLRRSVFALLGTFFLAGFIAPWVDASRWSPAIQSNLEESLGRKVSYQAVHLTLFTGPGLTFDQVVIGEDPRYGLEPFAYVPTLQVRLRLDKLLVGQIRVSSLSLVDPSLNLVKRSDGSWNVLDLIRRLGAPRRSPLHLFPFFEVSNGRVDFKFGTEKTPFYLLNAGISVYPERSGQLTMQLSGSPARTDRAGNGFGHFRGEVAWRPNATANENALQADLNLEPSNLSELTTLIEGQDVGVHGTVSSHFTATGPLRHLRLDGTVHFDDLHRWDLLPVSGQYWNIRYGGTVDLLANRLSVETWGKEVGSRQPEKTPLSLALEVNHFLTRPVWAVTARMSRIPLANVLPLGRRMGLSLPSNLNLTGSVDGEVTINSETGGRGAATLREVSATLPDLPPLRADAVNVNIQQDRVHFDLTDLQTTGGQLRLGGEFFFMSPRATAVVEARDFSVADLKAELSPWLGLPSCFELLEDGDLTGDLNYARDDSDAGVWSGRIQLANAGVHVPGLSKPIKKADARISFRGDEWDVSRFAGFLGERAVHATYRLAPAARHPQHLRVDLPAASLEDLESTLSPALEAQGWLARLHVAKRSIPSWLAARNMEGDVFINQFSVAGAGLGALSSHFTWRGTALELSNLLLRLNTSTLRAGGTVDMASYAPRYTFNGSLNAFHWAGGLLSANGSVESNGVGRDAVTNLRASGTFSASDVTFDADDSFYSNATGDFSLSADEGWPNLKLINIRAQSDDAIWNGGGSSQSDGKIVLDLEHEGEQRHVVGALLPTAAPLSFLNNR